MIMDMQEMVTEFHIHSGSAVNMPEADGVRALRARLVLEECDEVTDALLGKGTPEEVAKELADAVYVLIGSAISLGIDFNEAFARVHKSNMDKLGTVVEFDEGGKVLKPEGWQPPNMRGVALADQPEVRLSPDGSTLAARWEGGDWVSVKRDSATFMISRDPMGFF